MLAEPALPPDDTNPNSPQANPVELAPIARLLLTPREAAAALSISPRLLWSKTKLEEIPCIRLGKAVRYSQKALQEWIDNVTDK